MKEVAIKDICKKDSSSLKQKELMTEGKYPVYGARGIAGYLDSYHQDNAYIGIVKDGSGIGRVAFYPEKSSLIGTMQYILPKAGYDIRYIGYCLQSLDLSKYKQGAAIPHIYFRDYGERLVKVTDDLDEQQRIVERLDAAFENIDKLKANAEKQLAEAQTLFQKSLAKAMEPKEGWEVVKLESLCTDVVDCPHSTPRKAEHPTQYPCIRTSELKGGNIEWSSMQYLEEEEYIVRTARIKPQCNDIVYGREGTYGDAVLLPEGYFFSLGQRTMLFRPNIGKVVPKFLHYNVISSHVYEQAKAKNSGCGVGHVNVKDIKLFDIGIPKSLAEQQRIVERLDALSENIRKYEEIQRQIISECDALKQALLRKVFE